METQLGLTVIGPKGQQLRLQRNNPTFQAGRDILRQSLPAEQQWLKLQELVANPLKALVDWCERFGLVFKDEGDTLRLNDATLNRTRWLPLLNRTQAVGGSPKHLLQFAERLGGQAKDAKVGNIALHLQDDKLRGLQPGLLMKVDLPKEARTGDVVNESSTGSVPFLVSFSDILVQPDGALKPQCGMVLTQVSDEKDTADILAQPAILGFNRTYRCEEGSVDGWLEDLSFDSLKAARRNAKEIQDTGAEARIINRITGEPVSLL
ncbi:hypothetical protein WJ96_07485 [Burkholderia ubonensis]|uniref:Uncharacterized protein n=2 Tax=Burkholderia ubonensis TaxID=101571 RepID=A0AAW3MWN6_9BURK|nr:hypothetical protein [Burkholderia ubonensis]KVP97003.1 hypothetical protein WJ97_14385 [Burkholderia ubonensis]KVP98353.1 hypothetical protein WJ96_07485 [Burkholderia ubonensis]KVZ93051.1 hypothetical protein WL25_19145 [Burkholderia ubonensis]